MEVSTSFIFHVVLTASGRTDDSSSSPLCFCDRGQKYNFPVWFQSPRTKLTRKLIFSSFSHESFCYELCSWCSFINAAELSVRLSLSLGAAPHSGGEHAGKVKCGKRVYIFLSVMQFLSSLRAKIKVQTINLTNCTAYLCSQTLTI